MAEPNNYHGVLQPAGFPPLPDDWATEWETYMASDGQTQIFSALHRKKKFETDTDRPIRALIISHGIGEHGGRYLHFPHFLAQTVDIVLCPDHRGHGRSEGPRGHIQSFLDYSDDLAIAVERFKLKLKTLAPGKAEIHILGHSLGSLILLNLLNDHHDLGFSSVTASSPMLGISVQVPLSKRIAAGALSRVWGNLQLHTDLNASLLSHDPAVIEAYRKDRLVHDLCTPRLYVEMTSSMKRMAQRGAHSGSYFPLLMQVPMADKITSPQAAFAFFEAMKKSGEFQRDKAGNNLALRTYAGFFHESYNETGKQQAFEDLKSWIQSHSS